MKLEAARLYTTSLYSTVNYLLRWSAPGAGRVLFGCSLTPRREAPRGHPALWQFWQSWQSWQSRVLCPRTALYVWRCSPFVNLRLEELPAGPTCTCACTFSHLPGKTLRVQDTKPPTHAGYYLSLRYRICVAYSPKPLWAAVTCSSAVFLRDITHCLSKGSVQQSRH